MAGLGVFFSGVVVGVAIAVVADAASSLSSSCSR
jgi:hypothetical protein